MSINIFDADAYREFNSDLAGFSREQAWDHFQRYGLKENRRFSRFVDLDFYKYANPELATAGLKSNLDYFAHLQNHGIQEGRLFSPIVNMGLYVEFNPDLKPAFGTNREAAFNHLQTYALNEGREFSMIFDLNDYRGYYKDLAELNNTQLLSHLLMYGIKERRRSSNYFDLGHYSSFNEGLIPAEIDSPLEALYHFAKYGIKESPIIRQVSAYKLVYTYRFPRFFYDTLNLETSVNHSNLKIDRTDVAVDQAGNRYTSFYLFNEINEISDSKTYTTRKPQGVFLGKYDAYGNLMWEKPLELSNQENVFSGDKSVWLDQNNHVYLMANQISNIFQQSQKIEETHLGKYTTNGDLLWTKELSLNGKSYIHEVAIDDLNNFYVIGFTFDDLHVPTGRFIFKYNSNGEQLWKK
jgi:hypothetical protein